MAARDSLSPHPVDRGPSSPESPAPPRPQRVERIGHIHNLRGLATLFIIVGHTVTLFEWSANPGLERTLRYVFANGTTLFLFISGYLFEHLRGRFRLPHFWVKKFQNVVLPYLFCSIPAILFFTLVARRAGVEEDFYQQSRAEQVLDFLLTGAHVSPFWFVPTIIAFYIAAPLLLALFRHDRAFWALPLLMLVPLEVDRSLNPLTNLLAFMPVWVLGMACSRFSRVVDPLLQRSRYGLLALTLALAVMELNLTMATYTYLGYLQKVSLALCLMGLLLQWQRHADPWLAWAGSLSFGLFFVHSYVITAMKVALYLTPFNLPAGNLPGMAVAAVIAIALSAGLVKSLRRLFGPYSRQFIGV